MARVQASNDAELTRLRAEMDQLCATGTKDAVPAAMPPVEAAAQPSAAGAAVEAKAEPSAKSSAYDELDALFTQGMVGLGDSADIRLIDAVHVIKVAQAGGRFQKRQDLPASAFLTKKPAYTIFVSYGWLDKAHPDPDGWHLGILGPLLDLFVRSATAANGGAAVAVGFFIDFCCLWQAPRSEVQGASFGRALRNINYLYANARRTCGRRRRCPPARRAITGRAAGPFSSWSSRALSRIMILFCLAHRPGHARSRNTASLQPSWPQSLSRCAPPRPGEARAHGA